MRNDITPDDLKKMKLVNIEAVDAESLVDIRDVKINPDLSKEERIAQFLNQIGNPYCFRCNGCGLFAGLFQFNSLRRS